MAVYQAGWVAVAILGAGTSSVVWIAAAASRFEHNRGFALGIATPRSWSPASAGPTATWPADAT